MFVLFVIQLCKPTDNQPFNYKTFVMKETYMQYFGFRNPTFVLFTKARPITRRGHPPHKEGPHPLKRRFDTYQN